MQVVSERILKARKSHICDLCGLRIEKGIKYNYDFIVEGGDAWGFKSHLDCNHLAHIWFMEDDFNEGLDMIDFKEYVNLSYKAIAGEPANIKTQSFDEILIVVKNYLLAKS